MKGSLTYEANVKYSAIRHPPSVQLVPPGPIMYRMLFELCQTIGIEDQLAASVRVLEVR